MAKPNGTDEAGSKNLPPRLQIVSQFIRDLSFENVAMQKKLVPAGPPEIQVHVNLDAKKIDEGGAYEIAVTLNIASKDKPTGNTLFMLELGYCGIFKIENVQESFLHPFLMIECPRQMFPFIRRIVCDLTRDGGFPPFDMEVIDFAALYQKEMSKRRGDQNPGHSTTH